MFWINVVQIPLGYVGLLNPCAFAYRNVFNTFIIRISSYGARAVRVPTDEPLL